MKDLARVLKMIFCKHKPTHDGIIEGTWCEVRVYCSKCGKNLPHDF